MKIRTDFVTNSSSSSFVICRESWTIEDIYEYIRNRFVEWREKAKAVLAEYGNLVDDYARAIKLDDEIIKKYDISAFDLDLNFFDIEWVDKCETYQEYLAYIEPTLKEKYGEYWLFNYPFRIVDLTKEKDVAESIAGWYIPCVDGYNKEEFDEYGFCKNCAVVEQYGCYNEDICQYYRNKVNVRSKVNKIGKIIATSFGRYAVWGCESCYLPDYVAEYLEKNSELHCRHMG